MQVLTIEEIDATAGALGWSNNSAVMGAWTGAISGGIAGAINGSLA